MSITPKIGDKIRTTGHTGVIVDTYKAELAREYHALAATLGGHLSEVVDIATTLDLAADLRRRDELTEQLLGALAGMVKDLLDEPFTDTLLPSGRVRGTTDTYRDLALELADR